jgi:Lar family restriction alleviation protein
MSETLKPCPFCGGAAGRIIGMHNFNDVVVVCSGCGIEGPLFDCDHGSKKGQRITNTRNATEHWNTRKAKK